MEKKTALIISLLICALILGNYLFFYDFNSGRETVTIARVIDGDTAELDDGRTVRMLNINTPERGEYFSEEASEYLGRFEGKTVELEITGVERYGRLLGRFYTPQYINLEIVKLGLGHSLLVNEDEVESFKKAEEIAREAGKGIWERSEHYGCLDVEINKKEEYVSISNNCQVSLSGWTIKDETTRKYKLSNFEHKTFILYSEKGQNEGSKLYWGRGSVWNDDRDSIFIRDSKEKLVYFDNYGY